MISYLHLEACRAGYLQWQSTAIALANKAMQDTTYSSKVIGFIYVLHYNINARVKPKFFRDIRHNPFDFSSPRLCWSMLMAYPYRNMHSRVFSFCVSRLVCAGGHRRMPSFSFPRIENTSSKTLLLYLLSSPIRTPCASNTVSYDHSEWSAFYKEYP